MLGFGFYQTTLSLMDAAMITPGPMCVYSKKALLAVGGYDEKNITEDMEIALRLQKNSYKIKASHYAKVYTVVPSTIRQWIRQRLRWYRGKIYNTAKYRELLFSSKHGLLGNFSLPFTFMLEMGSVFILFLVAVMLMQSVLFMGDVIMSAMSINYNLPLYFPPVIIHSSAIFFFVTTLSTFGLAMAVSFDLAKEKFRLKDIPALLFIILFYGIMVALMWLTSLFKEINRSDYSW
jgi:cellulose synthase/poly-beta-1,6-N-acetylglucosamine synthase-like glycosyltransferase